jgi:hypothetical protein
MTIFLIHPFWKDKKRQNNFGDVRKILVSMNRLFGRKKSYPVEKILRIMNCNISSFRTKLFIVSTMCCGSTHTPKHTNTPSYQKTKDR